MLCMLVLLIFYVCCYRLSQLSAKYLIKRILNGTLINVNLGHLVLIYLTLINVVRKF